MAPSGAASFWWRAMGLRAARPPALHPAGRAADAAVREPWRAALGYGAQVGGVPEDRVRVVRRMIESGVNTGPDVPCGRLFDAVAAIIGLRTVVNFEAQAAIELETIAEDGNAARYPFEIEAGPLWQLDFRPMIEQIARETAEGAPQPSISANSTTPWADAIVETCRRIRGETKLARVCLSGGTFQNMRLLALAVTGLRGAGFGGLLAHQSAAQRWRHRPGQAAIVAESMKA